tara:strand:- start:4012 stop:6822 length:2811 start_codon:yes stop_codon:yes gene_type:complete
MPLVNQGWAYVSSSTAGGGTPGGGNTQVQFNDGGSFGGSADLTWDGSKLATTNISASSNVSASSFYGDGSNLTGITASAVNVADGPEQAVQFRVDTPVSGEISGSSKFMFMTASNTLKLDGASMHVSGASLQVSGTEAPLFHVTGEAGSLLFVTSSGLVGIGTDTPGFAGSGDTLLDVQGHLTIGKAGTAYIFNNNDADTYMKFGGSTPPGTDGMQFVVGGKRMLMLDENGTDRVIIGNSSSDFTIVSGSLIVSGNLEVCAGTASIAHLSGCSPITVHSPMSSSQAISASSFWVNGVELTGGAGGGGTPAGSNTQVQFNNGGAFGAASTFTFDSSANYLTLQGSASVSSSLTGGQEMFFGSGNNRSIGTLLMDDGGGGTIDYLAVGHGSGSVLLSASNSLEIIANSNLGVEVYGAPITVYPSLDTMTGSLFISPQGSLTGSYALFNADASSTKAGIHISASNPTYGPGAVYGSIRFGSGSVGGTGWDGSGIVLRNFGQELLEVFNNNGGLNLSGAGGIFASNDMSLNAALQANGAAQFNNTATFNNTTTFNNSASVHNRGIQVNGIASSNLNCNVTASFNQMVNMNQGFIVNNASGTLNQGIQVNGTSTHSLISNVTSSFNNVANFNNTTNLNSNINVGGTLNLNSNQINSTGQNYTWQLRDGQDGLSSNGALLFFTGSGGDLMKFHTSGSAKGVVMGSNVYMNSVGNNELQPAQNTNFYVSSSVNGYVTRTTAQQVFGNAAGAGLTASNSQLLVINPSPFTKVDSTHFYTTSSAAIGISGSAKTTLDVHYTGSGNPTSLSTSTGGGEVVYFGTGSLVNVGAVHYLNSDGGWAPVNANTTGSGHNQLLGIAMGTNPSTNGMLIKGFYNTTGAVGSYIGNFIKGGPVYIRSQTTPAQGYISGAAPTGSGQFVRVVGYGTDTAHVIYFNPDSTYIELA